jgi:hypothetical protein
LLIRRQEWGRNENGVLCRPTDGYLVDNHGLLQPIDIAVRTPHAACCTLHANTPKVHTFNPSFRRIKEPEEADFGHVSHEVANYTLPDLVGGQGSPLGFQAVAVVAVSG